MARKWFNEDGSRMECYFEACSNFVDANGVCNKHFKRLQREEYRTRARNTCPDSGAVFFCKLPGCETPSKSLGYCEVHYRRFKTEGEATLEPQYGPCPVTGCIWRKQRKGTVCARCGLKASKYGVSGEEIIRLFLPENRVCQNRGCGSVENLHLDHDHSCCPPGDVKHLVSCGECIRGWLCRSCNMSLGLLQENPRRIQGLLEYLAQCQSVS